MVRPPGGWPSTESNATAMAARFMWTSAPACHLSHTLSHKLHLPFFCHLPACCWMSSVVGLTLGKAKAAAYCAQ